jgi:hypothetical protein
MEPLSQQRIDIRQLSGIAAVVAAVAVLALIATGVARHPSSLQPPASQYLWTDVALLLTYGIAGMLVWRNAAVEDAAIGVGSVAGIVLAAVLVANHVIELFVLVRSFPLVLGPVLLALGVLGAAGSAAWQRTRSVAQALFAGIWCAVMAVLFALAAILPLIFIFAERAEAPLREPFAASGMSDAAGFLMRNSLEASLEALVRMPILSMCLSLAGALANIFLSKLPRRLALAGALIALLGLITGIAALWHADSLERSARPPFVMLGVVLTGLPFAAAHPIWSAYQRAQLKPTRGRPS